MAATGPDGWTVTGEIGSTANAASVVVTAGSTSSVSVTAKAPTGATAGDYPIAVDVTSGSEKAHADLQVTITGSYSLAMSTPSGVLSMNGSAGTATDLTLTLTNSGTADIPGVAMTASAPTGWVVTFDPTPVDVPAGQTVQVVAHVTPSSDAITGDYVATMTGTSSLATAKTDIRVTVQTSSLWGVIGIGLIAGHPARSVAGLPTLRTAMSEVVAATEPGPAAAAPVVEPAAIDPGPAGAGHPDPPPDQEIRRADSGQQARPGGLPGRDLRPARAERRRQDDDHPDAARPVRADIG